MEGTRSGAGLTVNQLHAKFVEELGWIDEVMVSEVRVDLICSN
jgi:hypothetical protein